ncbi:hypothetical protein CCACVL1_00376, partial [Corchorus capsularis]
RTAHISNDLEDISLFNREFRSIGTDPHKQSTTSVLDRPSFLITALTATHSIKVVLRTTWARCGDSKSAFFFFFANRITLDKETKERVGPTSHSDHRDYISYNDEILE